MECASLGELVAGIALHATMPAGKVLLHLALELVNQWVVAILPVPLANPQSLDSLGLLASRQSSIRDLGAIGFFDDVLRKMQAVSS